MLLTECQTPKVSARCFTDGSPLDHKSKYKWTNGSHLQSLTLTFAPQLPVGEEYIPDTCTHPHTPSLKILQLLPKTNFAGHLPSENGSWDNHWYHQSSHWLKKRQKRRKKRQKEEKLKTHPSLFSHGTPPLYSKGWRLRYICVLDSWVYKCKAAKVHMLVAVIVTPNPPPPHHRDMRHYLAPTNGGNATEAPASSVVLLFLTCVCTFGGRLGC